MLRNFLFNLAGTLVPLLTAIVCIPIYLQYIGVAGYGIVAIYGAITMLAGVFDTAFSNTINRELAARSALADSQTVETGTIFRTLELFAWGVAAALAVALIATAPYLVEVWIGAQKYPTTT